MLPPAKSTPAASDAVLMPSTRASDWIKKSRSCGLAGARLKPQLPMTTVVTPCQLDGEHDGSNINCAS